MAQHQLLVRHKALKAAAHHHAPSTPSATGAATLKAAAALQMIDTGRDEVCVADRDDQLLASFCNSSGGLRRRLAASLDF